MLANVLADTTATISRQYKLYLPPVHAVKFIPHVTKDPVMTDPPDGILVHHMDLFLCTEALGSYPTVTHGIDWTMDQQSECDDDLEMCGPRFMYYQHDWRNSYKAG